jgi:hypothetical protein
MSKKYKVDPIFRVWGEEGDWSIEVGGDQDGLEMAEIRVRTHPDNIIVMRQTLPIEMLASFRDAINKYLEVKGN